jgi:hypothetical protein
MIKDDNVWDNRTSSILEKDAALAGKLRNNALDIDFRRIISFYAAYWVI